ncbi:MAG: hypothetical protein H6862_02135 [Rhodospirillales bacterium]|nr:hypothetical protein [Rhodospirillales bacterium]
MDNFSGFKNPTVGDRLIDWFAGAASFVVAPALGIAALFSDRALDTVQRWDTSCDWMKKPPENAPR